jgi:hypothetical protein
MYVGLHAQRAASLPPYRGARKDNTMRREILAVAALGFMTIVLSACEAKGPMQKGGEKMDRATDQDKLIGKGPVEKAGKNIDDAVKDLKK